MNEAGNVLESETYVGGHVEAIESGKFERKIFFTNFLKGLFFQESLGLIFHVVSV